MPQQGNRRVRQSRSRRKENTGGKNERNLSNSNSMTKNTQQEDRKRMEQSKAKFEEHKNEAKQSIQKMLQDLSDSDSDSDNESQENIARITQLQKTMRGEYSGDDIYCEKASQNQQATCVVCLEKVRAKDSIWQCDQCFCLLHLPCTQGWARSCYCEKTGGNEDENGYWACPKCRKAYPRREIPRSYRCFCGKVENPPIDHWIVPHSCGSICHKALKPECGHECTLRCHPGACPPCPQTVQATCYCESETTLRRCNDRKYSCGTTCGKTLACGIHQCEEYCHDGECPPCPKTRIARCECGAEESLIPCADGKYHCEKVCGKPLSCGNHICTVTCHSGDCIGCPMEGPRPCHCGKVTFENLACDEPTPSCEDTCNKPLHCYGNHRCNRRCHPGECDRCRVHIVKSCRCGQSKKSVQCFQEYICEKKCNRVRDCKAHRCGKKCCPGDCPPCNEICGKPLSCGNHRCQAICHPNACFPCPVTVQVTCFCKSASVTVPCGAKKKTKIPKCRKDCEVPPTCHHEKREPHSCHFGQCPPCKQICKVIPKECSHSCPQPCHDPIPPWPTKPKLLRKFDPRKQKSLPISQVQCPLCEYPVQRQCFGLHAKYDVPCHSSRLFDCKRICGNQLACGNHKCQVPCHIVTKIRDERQIDADPNDTPTKEAFSAFKCTLPVLEGKLEEYTGVPTLGEITKFFRQKYKDTCRACELPCMKKRNPPCKHSCPLPCHPEECPPCEVLVRKYCHCPLRILTVMKCFETNISKNEMDKKLSCGEECTKKLSCGHTCKLVCHSGNCRPVGECKTKVRRQCACKHLKIKFVCSEAPEAVPCDESCQKNKEQQEEKKRQKEAAQRAKEEKEREENQLQPQQRKRRRPRKERSVQTSPKKANPLLSQLRGLYSTLTSEKFWKVVFVYSLPFLLLFVFVLLALIKN